MWLIGAFRCNFGRDDRMIALRDVSKELGEFSCSKVNYVFANSLYQLNGENGSGKSVLLKIIAGFDRKITGKVENDQAKKPILFLTDTGIGLPYLNVRDNINLSAKILGVDISEEMFFPLFQADKYLETDYTKSSLGNQNKVGAALLFSETEYGLIVIDETLNGIDRQSTELILERLDELQTKQCCPIIFVSHAITLEHAKQVNIYEIIGGKNHE